MEEALLRWYRFLRKNWNAILAGSSLIAAAVFWLMPPLRAYVPVLAFVIANAIVWTLIEIKVGLAPATRRDVIYRNMRVARPNIIADIEERLERTTLEKPLELVLIGGRLRSMSDLVRELADDMRQNQVVGHAIVSMFCMDPSYAASRILPGGVDSDEQLRRNHSYGAIIESVTNELRDLVLPRSRRTSLTLNITYYREDPHYYAYLVGDTVLYWGFYTWSEDDADFVGPENACVRSCIENPEFTHLQAWLMNRSQLYAREAVSKAAKQVN